MIKHDLRLYLEEFKPLTSDNKNKQAASFKTGCLLFCISDPPYSNDVFLLVYRSHTLIHRAHTAVSAGSHDRNLSRDYESIEKSLEKLWKLWYNMLIIENEVETYG